MDASSRTLGSFVAQVSATEMVPLIGAVDVVAVIGQRTKPGLGVSHVSSGDVSSGHVSLRHVRIISDLN